MTAQPAPATRAQRNYVIGFSEQLDRCDVEIEVSALMEREKPNRAALKIGLNSAAGQEIIRLRDARLAKMKAADDRAETMGAA